MDSFPVKDFSGGMDDNYLSGNPNTGYLYSNLWIDVNAKPRCRPGVSCFTNRATTDIGSTIFTGLYLGERPFGRPIFFRKDKAYYIDTSDLFQEILGPTLNPALPDKPDGVNESVQIWQRQLIAVGGSGVYPTRIYCDSFSGGPVDGFTATYKALTLGLPALASDPTVTSTGGSGNNYIYAFVHYYTFTDFEGTVFEDTGPVTQVALANAGAPDADDVDITDIPVLANGTDFNYATTAVKIEIYRTANAGSTFFKVGEVTNGTTIFTDTMSDTTLVLQEGLYTNGGISENTPPPVDTAFVTQVNDTFWYATEQLVTHSLQGAPGAAPSTFYQYQPQKITGLSSIIGFPILFCDRGIYRIEGLYAEDGTGGFDLRELSKTAGCKSNRSIVAVPGGLVWAGNGGFYFTDGYQVKRIVNQLSTRYPIWTNEDVTGSYDPDRNMVFWTVTSTQSSNFSDLLAVLHLNFGVSDRTALTTWRSGKFSPTTSNYSDSLDVDTRFRSRLLAMDYRGYFLAFDDNYYTDPNINNQQSPADFTKSTIIYRYESSANDFGNDSMRKFCTELTCEMGTETNTAVQFLTRRDDGGSWRRMSEVRSDLPGGPGVILWDISEYGWDDPADEYLHGWNDQPVTEGKRQLPAGILRSNRRQIAFTNAMTQIAKSDNTCLANVDATAKTITLVDTDFSFPDDCEEYRIAFSDDEYASQWVIKEIISDTQITVWDPYGLLATLTNTKWQIKGYRKFDRAFILSYTVFFDAGEVTQAPQRGNRANGLVNTDG